jgi:hypothetical protein
MHLPRPQVASLLALFLVVGACSNAERSAPTPAERSAASIPVQVSKELHDAVGGTVDVTIRDTVLLWSGVELRVESAEIRLEPYGDFVDLEDPSSFEVFVDHLVFRVPGPQLVSGVATEGTPVKDVAMSTDGKMFVLNGHVNALGLPFEIRMEPSVTEDGRLALILEDVDLLKVGVMPFLSLLEQKGAPGLLVYEDDVLYIDLEDVNRPPDIHLIHTSAEVLGDDLVAIVGIPDPAANPAEHGSYLAIAGGVFRSGGSMLFDTTVTLVAKDGGELTIGSDFGRQMRDGFVKPGEGNTLTCHLDAPKSSERAPGQPSDGGGQ